MAVLTNIPNNTSARDWRDTMNSLIKRIAALEAAGVPVETPAPAFTTQPSISPTSGTAGSTVYAATPGTVSNGAVVSRAWLLNGTAISTGVTALPASSGTLAYQETASGPGGTTTSTVQVAAVTAAPVTPTPAPAFISQPSISPSTGTAGATTFTATAGNVSNGSISARSWTINGTVISTGTAASPASSGTLTYQETATGPGGTTQSTVQQVTVTTAAAAAPAFTSQPTVSPSTGTAGTTTYTATPGAVSNGSITSRAWALNGSTISTGPTAAPASAGTLTYQEFATGTGGSASSSILTRTVSAAAVTLGDLTLSPTTSTAGTSYNGVINGVTAGSVITGTVPDGLVLNSAARTITGTPTTASTAGFSLTETLGGAAGSPKANSIAFTVRAAAQTAVLKLLTVSPSSATVGTAYSGTIAGLTSGSTVTLSNAGAAGLTVQGAVITGTPTTAGTIDVVETLDGAQYSPRTSNGIVTVNATANVPIIRAVLSGQRLPDTPSPATGGPPTVDAEYVRCENRYVGSGDIATASFRLNGFYIWTDVAIKTKGAITYKELVVEVNGVCVNCLPNGPMVLPQGAVDIATPDIDWSPLGGPPVQGTLVRIKCRYSIPAGALGIGNSVADYEGVFARGFEPTGSTVTSLMTPGDPTVTGTLLTSTYTHCPIMVGTFVGGDKETIVFGGDSITVGSGDKGGQWAALPSLANGQSSTIGTWEQIHTQTDSRTLGFSYAGRALAGLEPSTKVGIAGIIVARIGGVATLWTNSNEVDNAADGLRALVKYGSTFFEAYGTNYFDGSTNAGGAPGNAYGNSRAVWNMVKANARTGSGVLPLQVGRSPIPPRRNRAADEVNAPLDQVVYGPKWDIDGNVATYLGLLDTAFANNEFDFYVNTTDISRRGSDKSAAPFHQWLHGNSTSEDGTHPSPDMTQPWARRVRRAVHAKRNGLPVLSTITWVSAPAIPEGATPNTVVGIINVKYETNLTMTNTAGGRFKMGRRLSGSTAEVLIAEVPTDYETSTSHQIEITESRSDLAVTSRATTLTISISDVSPEPVPEHAVVTAYKKARTVPLSTARYSALNTFIRAIDDAGALTKLSRLYVFADPEPVTSDGGLNIVSLATAKPIPGSAPTFEPNLGYTGNGAATGAISLRTPWTDSKYLQDDAAVGVWCNGEFGGTAGDGREHISASSGGAIWLTARSSGGTGTKTFRMNSGTTVTTRTGSTSRLGHRAASRTGATAAAAFHNGQQTATSDAASLAQTTTAQVLRAQASYSTDRIAALWSGGGLTAAQQAAMHSALYAYLKSFGAAGF